MITTSEIINIVTTHFSKPEHAKTICITLAAYDKSRYTRAAKRLKGMGYECEFAGYNVYGSAMCILNVSKCLTTPSA